MPPIAAYIRVSHVGKRRAGVDFHSPDDQRDEIEAWAKETGKKIEWLEPELDAKGNDANRPTFRRAVDGVKDGTYSGVVVAYLSRAGRDLRLMLDLWDEVEGAGGVVYFAREKLDGGTTTGRLQRNILASFAQHELEERREGFERACKGAVEAGIWQRHQTPRGYRKDKKTRGLVPDARAKSVQQAFRDVIAGDTISAVARRLKMTQSGVRQLIKNRVYLGELRVRSYENLTAHKPLIDLSTFEAAQAKLGGPRPAKSYDAPALLAGIVRCSACGHVMTRGLSGGRPCYRCPGYHSGAKCPAPAAAMTSQLDSYVEPIALAELARIHFKVRSGSSMESAEAKVREAERKLEEFLEAVEPEDVGGPLPYKRAARKRRDAIDDAREALRQELAQKPTLALDGTGADAWEKLDGHERNTLLRSLLAAVVVKPAGRGKRVPIADRARVIAHGVDLGLPVRNGSGFGIVPVAFPDADDDHVLGMPASEDEPQSLGSAA